MEVTRTINVPASASVQDVTLVDVGYIGGSTTLEIVQLDNTDELWVGAYNPTFTAAGDNDTFVVKAGADAGRFPVRPDLGDGQGGDVVIPVLYPTGGRVQFWFRN